MKFALLQFRMYAESLCVSPSLALYMRTRRINLGSKVTRVVASPFAVHTLARLRMASLAVTSTVILTFAVCLLANTRAAYESAGCSDQGCGIPCYMRPAADSCHYKPHSPCSNEGYDLDLENLILNLNSSLHRLENKLVQKRVSKSKP